jgi:hypothetical protein
MFTNKKGAVPATTDARRYAQFFTAQQTVDDLARDGMTGRYFPDLYNWLRAGGYAIVAHYLANYAIPDALNPATTLQRAPATSSTDEAISVSRTAIEQEIIEIVEQDSTPGMRGGWISSIALRRAIGERVSIRRQREILAALGYVPHPALPDGRANNTIHVPDAGKPRLFLRAGHIALNETRASEIARLYQQAQGLAIAESRAA